MALIGGGGKLHTSLIPCALLVLSPPAKYSNLPNPDAYTSLAPTPQPCPSPSTKGDNTNNYKTAQSNLLTAVPSAILFRHSVVLTFQPTTSNTFTSTSSRLFHHAFPAGAPIPRAFTTDTFNRLPTEDVFTFVWDTGCSRSITPDVWDFVDGPHPVPSHSKVLGFGNAAVSGIGTVEWVVLDDNRQPYTIKTSALLVPASRTRLLSTQSYLKELSSLDSSCSSMQTSTGIQLTLPHGTTLGIPYNAANNLPITSAARPLSLAKNNFEYNLCVTNEANQNLTAPQKELLRWHFRLGHRDMLATQHLLRGGHLGNDPVKLLAGKCALPKCASCQFGKQKRKCANPKSTPFLLHLFPPR